jgi:nicotinamide-nucleotide adenylyltransferase
MAKVGFYTGRFQPFHLGHLSAVKQALKQVDKLYIAIGSSQYDHEEYNPFTAEERADMIRLTLEEKGLLDRCEIFELPDIHDDDRWTAHVRKTVPPFDIVFVGNNGLVKELFDKFDTAKVIEVDHEVNISATKIRCAMNRGVEWEIHVSPKVAEYIKKIDGVERIRQF